MNRIKRSMQAVGNGLASLAMAGVIMFKSDYHAIRDDGSRTSPKRRTGSEDNSADAKAKTELVATVRDQHRNIELVGWLINCHLASVAEFSFQATTGNKELDKVLERFERRQSRKENFDLAKRRSRAEMLYLIESGRVIDGDIYPTFTTTGRVQVIEGDRVRTPKTGTERYKAIVQGVAKNPNTGEHLAYAVNRRTRNGGYEFQQWNRAGVSTQLDYCKRHDQDRGISPLVAARNRIQDLYEGLDAMAVKTKMQAMFGIAIEGADMSADDDFDIKDADGNDASADTPKDELNFKMENGLRLQTDGKVNTIESKTPHPAYMDWSYFEVQLILLALDIPFSFVDSRKSSYNARYADTQRYEKTNKKKRLQVVQWLTSWFLWQLEIEIAAAGLDLADYPIDDAGNVLTIDDFRSRYEELIEWVPGGIPFLDPKAEIEAAVTAIGAGLDSWDNFAKRHGMDIEKLKEQIKDYQNWAKENDVLIYVAKPGQPSLFENAEGMATGDDPATDDDQDADPDADDGDDNETDD